MSQYIGFSTKNHCSTNKKFKLTDSELVMQDLLNSFNIRQGTKVGQPNYGSRIWDFIFEPNISDVQNQIKTEIIRILSLDLRIETNSVTLYSEDHGILVELQISILPFNDPITTSIFFDQAANFASIV
jgi:phage baseplate assembly protein W